jgi:hypothetical protein
MRRLLAIVAAVGLLQGTTVVVAAEATRSAEKLPAPPRTPETGVDPGIQVHPGPTPDPHTAVPPKNNPDPEMAINPDVIPDGRSGPQRPAPNLDPNSRLPEAGSEKRSDSPKPR